MMARNSNGNFVSTVERDMLAYDTLPKPLRESIANAAFHWASEPFHRLLRDKSITASNVPAFLRW